MATESTRSGKALVKILSKMVDKNMSPMIAIKGGGKKGSSKVIDHWMNTWTTMSDKQEMAAYKSLIQQTVCRKDSSEISINMICRLAPGFSAWARDPLIHYIPHLKMPVSFILAEHDFLHFDGLPELFEQGQVFLGSQLTVIPDTGHQITTDAPEFTCNHVIEFVFG